MLNAWETKPQIVLACGFWRRNFQCRGELHSCLIGVQCLERFRNSFTYAVSHDGD